MPSTSSTSRVPGSRFADPAALMRIRNLELRARMVVEGFWKGLHNSPYHGFSNEFTEYRSYVRGDDLRYLAWKVLARSDRYYIRKFKEDTNTSTFLLLDRSRSMEFGPGGYSKADYASTLAATLAYFLREQGDAVSLLTFAAGMESYLPPRGSRKHLSELLARLEQPARGAGTAFDAPIGQILRSVKRRGLIVLISDLLAPPEKFEALLAKLTASGHDVTLFHILDRAEIDFPYSDATIFEDMESDRRFPTPPGVRENYLRRLRAHLAAIRALCLRRGVIHRLFPTDEHLEKALFEHLSDRARLRRARTRRA